jgi:large subunit ribosomal protein L22
LPKWGYSIIEEELDFEKTIKVSGREVRVSHKLASEVCRTIKGMMLNKAKQFLKEVMAKERPVPIRRFRKKAGHRHGLTKAFAGRYPIKTAKTILKLLTSAEANAENKGLDIDRMRIIHAAAYPGMKVKHFRPRAQGRSSPKIDTLTHIELVLEERPEARGEA